MSRRTPGHHTTGTPKPARHRRVASHTNRPASKPLAPIAESPEDKERLNAQVKQAIRKLKAAKKTYQNHLHASAMNPKTPTPTQADTAKTTGIQPSVAVTQQSSAQTADAASTAAAQIPHRQPKRKLNTGEATKPMQGSVTTGKAEQPQRDLAKPKRSRRQYQQNPKAATPNSPKLTAGEIKAKQAEAQTDLFRKITKDAITYEFAKPIIHYLQGKLKRPKSHQAKINLAHHILFIYAHACYGSYAHIAVKAALKQAGYDDGKIKALDMTSWENLNQKQLDLFSNSRLRKILNGLVTKETYEKLPAELKEKITQPRALVSGSDKSPQFPPAYGR